MLWKTITCEYTINYNVLETSGKYKKKSSSLHHLILKRLAAWTCFPNMDGHFIRRIEKSTPKRSHQGISRQCRSYGETL